MRGTWEDRHRSAVCVGTDLLVRSYIQIVWHLPFRFRHDTHLSRGQQRNDGFQPREQLNSPHHISHRNDHWTHQGFGRCYVQRT